MTTKMGSDPAKNFHSNENKNRGKYQTNSKTIDPHQIANITDLNFDVTDVADF